MVKELRIGERQEVPGSVEMEPPESEETWELNGYDVSPTALAVTVPTNHEAMEKLAELFRRGNAVEVEHDMFGSKRAVLHRVFSHRNDRTKWVLSFFQRVELA